MGGSGATGTHDNPGTTQAASSQTLANTLMLDEREAIRSEIRRLAERRSATFERYLTVTTASIGAALAIAGIVQPPGIQWQILVLLLLLSLTLGVISFRGEMHRDVRFAFLAGRRDDVNAYFQRRCPELASHFVVENAIPRVNIPRGATDRKLALQGVRYGGTQTLIAAGNALIGAIITFTVLFSALGVTMVVMDIAIALVVLALLGLVQIAYATRLYRGL